MGQITLDLQSDLFVLPTPVVAPQRSLAEDLPTAIQEKILQLLEQHRIMTVATTVGYENERGFEPTDLVAC